jgi:hypothetical protein
VKAREYIERKRARKAQRNRELDLEINRRYDAGERLEPANAAQARRMAKALRRGAEEEENGRAMQRLAALESGAYL